MLVVCLAAYGPVYLPFARCLLFERARPDRSDLTGVALGLLGGCLYAPR